MLSISTWEALRQQQLRERREPFIGGRGGDISKPATFSASTLAAEAMAAPAASWLWAHPDCTPEKNDYVIDGRRIDTAAKALVWTLHVGQKGWFDPIMWQQAILRMFELPMSC